MPGTSYGPEETDACPDAVWRFIDCDVSQPSLRCASIDDCARCVETDGCGFCRSASDCRELYHPQGCELVTYAESAECRDHECASIDGCDECISQENCGFCFDSDTCQAVGGSSTCLLVTATSATDCDTARCESIDDCEECARLEGCRWCIEERECRHRDTPQGCEFLTTSCEEDPCESAANCEECLGFNYVTPQLECGWCYLWDFCTSDRDSCPDAYTIVNYCPPENDCREYEDCVECTLGGDCGWCEACIPWEGELYNGCVAVNGRGMPYGGPCYGLEVRYGECSQRPCTSYSTCSDCVGGDSVCAWCETGSMRQTCISASVNDNTTYFCDDLATTYQSCYE